MQSGNFSVFGIGDILDSYPLETSFENNAYVIEPIKNSIYSKMVSVCRENKDSSIRYSVIFSIRTNGEASVLIDTERYYFENNIQLEVDTHKEIFYTGKITILTKNKPIVKLINSTYISIKSIEGKEFKVV